MEGRDFDNAIIINRDNLLRATGIVLKKERKNSKKSQIELAVEAGFAKNTISNIENGKKSPTIETLFRLFACLETDIDKYIELVRMEYLHLEKIDQLYKK